LNQAAGFPYGLGVAQRATGAVELAEGEPLRALGHLAEALATFSRIEATYEAARTRLLLARGEHARGGPAAAAAYLIAANRLFADLDVPQWVERTIGLAREMGISLEGAIASSSSVDG
jgi:hypothetical protein